MTASSMTTREDDAQARDRWADAGIATVGFAAAVSSWAGWVSLAELTGWTQQLTLPGEVSLKLSWLLPLAVEAYALTSARAWLRLPWASAVTRKFAGWSMALAITASIGANAVAHLLTAEGVKVAPWPVTVAVAALPPIMLGAVALLNALINKDRATSSDVVAVAPATSTELAPAAKPSVVAALPDAVPELRAAANKAVPSKSANASNSRDYTALMRRTWERHLNEHGTPPTGAELARATGASESLGRRNASKWRHELEHDRNVRTEKGMSHVD